MIPNNLKIENCFLQNQLKKDKSAQDGFSLIEVTIAMIVFLIVVFGVFITFTFVVSHNAGNISRAQSLAILRQKIEQMRSAKFTDSVLIGGTKPTETYTGADGNKFLLQVIVDDDPFAPNVQVDSTKTLKEISVTVNLDRPTPGWQTSVPATVVLRRVRGN